MIDPQEFCQHLLPEDYPNNGKGQPWDDRDTFENNGLVHGTQRGAAMKGINPGELHHLHEVTRSHEREREMIQTCLPDH